MTPRWPRLIHPPVPATPTGADAPQPGSVDQLLLGRTVIWTRPAEAEESMAQALAAAGAEVVEAPAIEFASFIERNLKQCRRVIEELSGQQGWLILPSPTAIHYFAELIFRIHLDPAMLTGVWVATIGRACVEQLRDHRMMVHFVPPVPNGRSLAETLPAEPGTPIVIAGSSQTRPELREGLAARGMRVQVLPLYAPRPSRAGLQAIGQALKAQSEPLVAVTSPSGVDALMEFIRAHARLQAVAATVRWVAIGPTTHRRLLDWEVAPERAAEAATPTAEGIIDAIQAVLAPDAKAGEGATPQ